MKKEDIESLKALTSSMDWEDLVSGIIEMEREILELEPLITKKELKDRKRELKIYEEAKANLVERQSKPYAREQYEYGIHYASAGNDDEEIY